MMIAVNTFHLHLHCWSIPVLLMCTDVAPESFSLVNSVGTSMRRSMARRMFTRIDRMFDMVHYWCGVAYMHYLCVADLRRSGIAVSHHTVRDVGQYCRLVVQFLYRTQPSALLVLHVDCHCFGACFICRILDDPLARFGGRRQRHHHHDLEPLVMGIIRDVGVVR